MKKHILHSLGLIAALTCLSAAPALAMEQASGTPKTEKTMPATTQQMAFTKDAFMAAQASGMPFVVAFHKKGCPLCIKQQAAFNNIYNNPAHMNLRVLVVDYLNDTQSLKAFNVGKQGTLIVFEGDKEISRTEGLVEAAAIEKQLRG